jgi:hypothetical protein
MGSAGLLLLFRSETAFRATIAYARVSFGVIGLYRPQSPAKNKGPFPTALLSRRIDELDENPRRLSVAIPALRSMGIFMLLMSALAEASGVIAFVS